MLPRTANVGASWLSAFNTVGAPTSPAWMIKSEPARAARACGLISPCVSEMMPTCMAFHETHEAYDLISQDGERSLYAPPRVRVFLTLVGEGRKLSRILDRQQRLHGFSP